MINLVEGTNRQDIGLEAIYIPEPLATLYGIVQDVDTGNSISGVSVSIVGTVFSATSLSNGGYEITNIPIGNYTVQFSHPDYETLEI